MRQPLARRQLPERAQDRQLALPADDRGDRQRPLARLRPRLQRDPRADGMLLALRDHRLGGLVLDRVARLAVGLLADDHAVDRRGRLQARRRVDDVARDHRLAERRPRAERDHRLTRVDRDADLQVAAGELPDAVADHERGAHRALRVVAVRERRAEEAHHRVADELLDHAAERLDLTPDALVVRRQHRADVFRVEPLGPRGEADQVDEDHRHDPPLDPRRLVGGHRRTAQQAEPGDVRVLGATGQALPHVPTLRR